MSKSKIPLSKKDKIKGLKIPDNVSSDLAYLCGILAGDGSLHFREAKNEYALKCVGNPKDEKEFYYAILKPLFKEVFGLDIVLKKLDSGTTFGFTIYSKALVVYLTKTIGLPLGKKYLSLKIPGMFGDKNLKIAFLKGVFDTDGSVAFKKRYRDYPYYPVISVSSRSKTFVKEISIILKELGFNFHETYDYKIKDNRNEMGYTKISRIELNGRKNLLSWIEQIGFNNSKHIEKIKKYGNL